MSTAPSDPQKSALAKLAALAKAEREMPQAAGDALRIEIQTERAEPKALRPLGPAGAERAPITFSDLPADQASIPKVDPMHAPHNRPPLRPRRAGAGR